MESAVVRMSRRNSFYRESRAGLTTGKAPLTSRGFSRGAEDADDSHPVSEHVMLWSQSRSPDWSRSVWGGDLCPP